MRSVFAQTDAAMQEIAHFADGHGHDGALLLFGEGTARPAAELAFGVAPHVR